MIRLFVALELPLGVRERLAGLAWPIAGARWVEQENLHLTLRFIGEVDEVLAGDIDEGLARIRFDRFVMELAGAGQFGSSRGSQTLWVGTGADTHWHRLQAKIERTIVGAGVAPERRKFHPHVTLARLRRGTGAKIDEFVAAHTGLALGPIRVENFALMSSHLGRNGADYTTEVRYPLQGGAPAGAGSGGADPTGEMLS
ncbi:MAG: RNA 2',3'-cyclic phosphodiesterase [Alphaproteobacteria bacterium]